MSKTAEDRIAELESQLKESVGTSTKLRDNYNQLYRHAQESEPRHITVVSLNLLPWRQPRRRLLLT